MEEQALKAGCHRHTEKYTSVKNNDDRVHPLICKAQFMIQEKAKQMEGRKELYIWSLDGNRFR